MEVSVRMLTVRYYHVSVLPLNRYFSRTPNHRHSVMTPTIKMSAQCVMCTDPQCLVCGERATPAPDI